MEFRYLGFDQTLNTRTYRFKSMVNGDPALFFLVTADLNLFLAHHVGIQEGPALCAKKLATDLGNPAAENHELTHEDLRAYVSARALAEAQKAESRRRSARHHQ